MPRTIQQRVSFSASPEALYEIYMSSRKHSAATGGPAVLSRKVGGRFTAWGDHLSGKTIALVPGRMIVQTWRGSNWRKRDADSILILTFEKAARGGRVYLVHANVPDAHAASINRGWHTYYWRPWRAYLRKVGKR